MKMTKKESIKVELKQGSIEFAYSGDCLEMVMREAASQGDVGQSVTIEISRQDMEAARAGLMELTKILAKATGLAMTVHPMEQ